MKGSAKNIVDEVPGSAGATSKKAKRGTLEKHLDEINKELLSKSNGSSSAGKGTKKGKLRPANEIVLLEQKCVLLLKLKRFKEVIEDGYSIIGRTGANVVIYKCILIALVRQGKSEYDILELLEGWRKATPKCLHMTETKRKFDGYLAALRSGVKHTDIFSNVEEALGLNALTILSKQSNEADDERKWRFRPPPPRHTAFSICPRESSGNSCIYGDECLFAHSNDELKEWKLRVEGEKKEATNVSNDIAVDAVDTFNRSSKKRPVPNIYRTLLIPPLCIHYLLDLGKKIKETTDIKDILVDEVQGIRIKVGTPLKYQRRIDESNGVHCLWSFMIASKMPCGTISILHDANRESFSITSGIYYNKKKESLSLIELHPNNKIQTKLQVLNTFIQPSLFLRFNYGWPDMCYYKVEVSFQSTAPDPGLYRQSIVFDFKKDPKIVKHICVEVLPTLDLPANSLPETFPVVKSVWSTPSPISRPSCLESTYQSNEPVTVNCNGSNDTSSFISTQWDFPMLQSFRPSAETADFYNKTVGSVSVPVDVVDSDTGVIVNLEGTLGNFECEGAGNVNFFYTDEDLLTKENYGLFMRGFLEVELRARRKILHDLRKTVNLHLFEKYSVSSDCVFKYPCRGELYGSLELESDIAGTTKAGKLVAESCSDVLICSLKSDAGSVFRQSGRRYLCKVVEKSKSSLILAIGKTAVKELHMLHGTVRRMQIQFVYDSTYFEGILDMLKRISQRQFDLLFPSFENYAFPMMRVIDSIGLLNEEELHLNNKQRSIYDLLTGRKALVPDDTVSPPLLVTGSAGSGKTYILAHCLRALLRSYSQLQATRILICTQSDRAADIFITEYLHHWLINDQLSVQRSKPLRIYNKARSPDNVSGAVKHYCIFTSDGVNFRSPTKEEVLLHKIILVTFSSCSELLQLNLKDDAFSHIFVDDATFSLEPECIQPLLLAGENTQLVVAGDVMQNYLGMLAISKGTPPVSLLERLRNLYPFRHPYVVNLLENYISHEVIIKFTSEAFYHDQLRPASNQPCHPQYYPLTFQHVSSSRELLGENGGGYYNMEEISQIVDFTDKLLQSWPAVWGNVDEKDNVVVLTSYTNHLFGLRVQLQLKGLNNVNAEMASNVLGRRFRVVIISTVITNRSYGEEDSLLFGSRDDDFFSDKRLINTAVSCAKSLVVVFGDAFNLWSKGNCRDIWQKYLTECNANSSLLGFSQAAAQTKAEETKSESQGLRDNLPSSLASSVAHCESTLNSTVPALLGTEKTPQLVYSESALCAKVPVGRPLEHTPKTIDQQSMNNVWSGGSNLHDAPSTDLFSAFSSNSETLYRNSPSKAKPVKEAGPASLNCIKKHFDTENARSDVFRPENYRSPFDLPSAASKRYASDVSGSSKLGYGYAESQPVTSFPLITSSHESMPMPTPLPISSTPSHVLFDRSPVLGNGNLFIGPAETNKPTDCGSTISSAYISPLMRGPPPGFLLESCQPKPTFSDNKISYKNREIGQKGYKRNTYEFPPRMLKNLQLSNNNRSPTRRRSTGRRNQVEMNFFDELGVDSQLEKDCCSSSSSSESLFNDNEDTPAAVKDNYQNSLSPSDWIEVRSNKKGKQMVSKKEKLRKGKGIPTTDEGDMDSEMCVDDKIELITQMGFAKTQALKALQACNKDLQSAVDWLITKSSCSK